MPSRRPNAMVKVAQDTNSKEDALLRALKKLDDKLKAENFKYELERRRFFVKPGERRRMKSKAARRRRRYELAHEQS